MSPEHPKPNPSIRERLTPLPPQEMILLRQRERTTARRKAGLWVGVGLGVAYFGISQAINPLALPGLPIYQLPPGLPWSALIAGVVCALVGLVTAWSESVALGVFFGSLIGTLAFDGYAIVNTLPDRVAPALIIGFLVLVLLPMTAMTAAFIGLFRWALERQISTQLEQRSRWLRVAIPLILLLAAGGFGATALYPESGRQVLLRMNQLILAGQAASRADLPAQLANDNVKDFKANVVGPYTLEWSKDTNNRYAIARPANTGGNESIAIARFTNNYLLICLFPNAYAPPECVSRTLAP
jgi:hypothetical protein